MDAAKARPPVADGEPADAAAAPQTLAEVLLRRAARHPDAPFVLTLPATENAGVEARSYADVLDRSQALATRLAEHGVVAGTTVGCYFSNSPAWIVASFAAWWLGATVAAVGTLVPASEADQLFGLSGAQVLLTEGESPGLCHPTIEVDSEGRLPGAGGSRPSGSAPTPPDPEATACVFFTSGTTGRPKGIPHTNRALLESGRKVAAAYARSSDYRPDAAPANLAPGAIFNPFGHAAGYGRLAFRMWIGRPSLLVPKFSVAAVKRLLEEFPIDTLQLSPTMVHMLATTDEELSLESLSYVTSGTAPLTIATRDLFETRYGVPVIQAYGMTEVGTISQERLEDALAGRRGPGSVGRIPAGVEVRIRPLNDGRADESRADGEILVRNDHLPAAFVGAQRVPLDEEGWFATGDVGHLDEHGILYLTGRLQDKLIVGGFNVYPAEVEDVLRQSPLVRDAVVVGLADERLGECPVAGVVWAGEPNDAALVAHARDRLAHYKAPRSLFDLDAVPLTARDKVDRRRVAQLAHERLGT